MDWLGGGGGGGGGGVPVDFLCRECRHDTGIRFLR